MAKHMHVKQIKVTFRVEGSDTFEQTLEDYLSTELNKGFFPLRIDYVTTSQAAGYVDEVSAIVVTTDVSWLAPKS